MRWKMKGMIGVAALLGGAMLLAGPGVTTANAEMPREWTSERSQDREVRDRQREVEKQREEERQRRQQAEEERARQAEEARAEEERRRQAAEAEAERRRQAEQQTEDAQPDADRTAEAADRAPRERPPHPQDLGDPSDAETQAMRRILHEEIKYRNRLAQLARLRELAEAQGNEERLRAIDALEQRLHEQHEAKIARAREQAGRRFDRVQAHLERGRVRPAHAGPRGAGEAPGKAAPAERERDERDRSGSATSMHGQDSERGRPTDKAPSQDNRRDDAGKGAGSAKGKGGGR